jgi:hypothetical protein
MAKMKVLGWCGPMALFVGYAVAACSSQSATTTGGPTYCTNIPPDGPAVGAQGGPSCNGDFRSGTSAPCQLFLPFCRPNGLCGYCLTDADCALAPGHAGDLCDNSPRSTINTSTHGECGTSPTSLGACSTDRFNSGYICAAKYPNGTSITLDDADACLSGAISVWKSYAGSTFTCGNPNNATCRANADCAAGVCNTAGLCGAPLGAPCDPNALVTQPTCASSSCDVNKCVCSPSCLQDSDCGNSVSGMVCATDPNIAACVHGCRGKGGNGCNYGQTCSSRDGTIGNCI